MQVFDLGDPANPSLVGEFKTAGNGNGIVFSDNNIYLADTYSFMVLHSNITGIEDDNPLPKSFSLSQNYPNPFNAQTSFAILYPNQGKPT